MNNLPQYKVVDFDGVWCWVKQPDDSYLVDRNFEQKFIEEYS